MELCLTITFRARHPGSSRRPARSVPKGRQVEPSAIEEIKELLGGTAPSARYADRGPTPDPRPPRPSLGAPSCSTRCGAAHGADRVYEVATFYAHFDVVRENDTAPPPVTVRVCDSLSCAMAGAEALLGALADGLGPEVRVMRAPCVGRCDTAPSLRLGITTSTMPIRRRSPRQWQTSPRPVVPPYSDLDAYRAAGGYRCWSNCASAITGEQVIDTSTRRACGAAVVRVSHRAQMAFRVRRAGPAADGGECRRRRAGHDQGSLFPEIRSASCARRHADRRPCGRRDRHLFLPARRVSGGAFVLRRNWISPGGRADRRVKRSSPPRRWRLYLRRRVRDD